MSMTNYAELQFLDLLFRGTAIALPASWHFALFSAAPGEGGGGTEITGSGQARVAVARNTTNFGNANPCLSLTEIAFPVVTASPIDVVAIALMDAASAGNMWFYAELADPAKWCTGLAATDTFALTSHGYVSGNPVRFRQITNEANSLALPGGIVSGTTFYVVNATANDFQVSTTPGGAPVNVTADGCSEVMLWKGRTVGVGDNLRITPGQWQFRMA